MPAMLEIESLVKRFGPITAVDGVSFVLDRGEVLGFLGPNGAGKSTTMKMITGFLRPDSGTVRVCGCDIEEEPIAAKARIGYLPEGAPAYGDMTPAQFLKFIASVRGLRGAEARQAIDRAIATVALEQVVHQSIETLSKGFKRRVGLAQAILHDPDILVLDEPTDGLDPNQKHQVRGLIQRMAQHKAIIISTHILEEVEAVCSRAIIIDEGRVICDGPPGDLLARSRYHQAVSITLALESAGAASAVFTALDGVAAVEQEPAGEGRARLTVLPGKGAAVLAAVAQNAQTEAWRVEEIYVEHGRLDEVFRDLTTNDAK
jgi:ABC-2 type transport system ATP-binding protein